MSDLSLTTNVITTKIKQCRFNKFLIENLDPLKRQSIITYEPCVVSSVKYKKAFKFIVIERDGVCLTENPPETYHKVIKFADIIDVTMEPDQPDFLKGKDHDDSQHITIKYLSNQKLNKEIQKELKTFYSEKNKKLKNAKNKQPTENANDFKTIEKLLMPSMAMIGKITVGKIISTNIRKKGKTENSTIDSKQRQNVLNPKNENVKETTDIIITTNQPKTSSPFLAVYYDNIKFSENDQTVKELKKNQYIILPMSVKSSTNQEALSIGAKYTDEEQVGGLLKSIRMKIGLKRIKPHVTEQLQTNLKNANLVFNAMDAVNKDVEDEEKTKFENETIEKTTVEFLYDESEESKKAEKSYLAEELLDVYLLNRYSMFYFYLRQAWINFKIKQADGDFETKNNHLCTTETLTKKFKKFKSGLELVSLKFKLANCSNILENIKQELQSCSQSKKYFWQDDDLFIKLLELNEAVKGAWFAMNKNNEILLKFQLDILCILTSALSETEAYERRISHVTRNRGKCLIRLIDEIILFKLPDLEDEDNYEDRINFNVDYTVNSIHLLYELLILSVQAPFCTEDDGETSVNIQWFVSRIETRENSWKFFEMLMMIVTSSVTINGTKVDGNPLKLDTMVVAVLYKCFFILNKFLEYGGRLLHWLRENYEIDFKYTLDMQSVMEKMPNSCVLAYDLRQLMDQVTKCVLTTT